MEKKAIYAVVLAALIAGSNGILIKAMPSLTTGAIGWFRAGVPVLFFETFRNVLGSPNTEYYE